jgi:hypothetical protein
MSLSELYLESRDDYAGPHNWFRPLSGYVDAVVLTATVNTNYTVPANVRMIVLSATADFYAKSGGTAAIPGASVTNGSGSELNPVALRVSPGDVIGFISASNAIITLSCWS